MIGVEHLEDWRGKPVLDPNGENLGKLEEVFLDGTSHTPVLVSVKSGLLGRRVALVPVNDATVAPEYLRVVHAQDTVAQAAASGEGAPDADALDSLGRLYGLRFAEGLTLEAAGDIEARRAEADAARRRAAELEIEAERKAAARDEARERAAGAGEDAGRAEREAQEAQRAAEQARAEAEHHSDP